MDCKEIKVMLNALVDGEVNDSDREIIMSHIAECEDCKKEYEELLAIRDAFGNLGCALPEGKLAESTMKEIYKKVYPEKKKSFLFRHMGTVAALFIVAIFCIYTMNSNTKDAVKEEANENKPIQTMKTEGDYAFGVMKPENNKSESSFDEESEIADNVMEDTQTPAEMLPEEDIPIPEAPLESEEPKIEAPKAEEPKSESSINEDPKSATPSFPKPGQDSTVSDFFTDFRFSNSIEFDISIIFVDSDIPTLMNLFSSAKPIASNGIKLPVQPVKVMDILYSNNITVTSSDLPENSLETIIYAE